MKSLSEEIGDLIMQFAEFLAGYDGPLNLRSFLLFAAVFCCATAVMIGLRSSNRSIVLASKMVYWAAVIFGATVFIYGSWLIFLVDVSVASFRIYHSQTC